MQRFLLASPVLLLALPLSAQDDYDWFQRGWYAGASGGVADANAGGSDVDADLAAIGFPGLSTSLDDTDVGWKAYGGYRFERPFALEFGYSDLGTITSNIAGSVPDLPAFLNGLATVHPFNGQGFTAAVLAFPVQTDNFQGMIKAGGWVWEADVDIQAITGQSVEIDEDGIDPFFGVGVLWDLGRDISFRAEYEKYYLDGDDVDFVSVGLQVQFT